MFKKLWVAAAVAALAMVWALSAQSPAQKAIDDSMKAMGVSDVKTLTIWGEGGDGAVGQARVSTGPYWRWYSNKEFVRGYDFDAKGYRTKRIRGEGSVPPGGGNGTTTPAPTQNQDQPTMANNFNGLVEMAMTPIGFLKAAQANNATVSQRTEKGKKYTVLSYPITAGAGAATYQTSVNGFIDDKGMVQKVEVMINHDFLGDIKWDAQFTDWKDFGGVKFPSKIVQHQWEPKLFELAVSDVKINQPVDLAAPQGKGGGAPGGAKGGAPGGAAKGGGAKGGAPGGPQPLAEGPGGAGAAKGGPGGPGAAKGGAAPTATEDLGGGFWLVTGGYASVICDFKDYVILIEGPSNDMRMDQIIAEAHRLVPNKPIKYVVNTHFHFDHTGGLRAAVANGITIVTQQGNKGLYEKVMANPHTLVPDELQKKTPRSKVKVEYVGEKKVFTDGTHTVELHHLLGGTHDDAMMVVYLPKQKILINADEFNVGQPLSAPVANPNQYQVNFLNEVTRLKLDVDRHIPIHLPGDGRKVTQQELRFMAGKQ